MNCRRCKAENPDTSRYCSACGALLTGSLARPKKTVPWYVFAGAGALAIIAAVLILLPALKPSPHPAEPPGSTSAAESTAQPGSVESSPSPAAPALAAGRFTLDGPVRGAPAAIEAALFDGSWAALPLWGFLGMAAPRLEGAGPAAIPPAWVDWDFPEPVVLCRFALGESLRTPELAPFSGASVLEWRPLSGERTSSVIDPGPLRAAGSFKSFSLFSGIDAPGVLVQAGRIVGWTFGQGVALGYLWAPADGAGPKPVRSTADLLASLRTAHPREAALAQAVSMSEDLAPARRLEALAVAFRLSPMLSPDDLTVHLKPPVVAARMSSLVSSMIEQGLAEEAARALDPGLLASVSDLGLVKAAARAANEARGFDAAHRLLADLKREAAFQGAASRELGVLEVELAKSALHTILDERGYGGLEIFEEAGRLAPDDLELHLLGVEVAVLEKKWGRASDLLQARRYPVTLSDRVRTLERLVDEGLREEESVTIRFNPGDKLIPVHAVINKTHRQKFYIDTGATTTIIPPSAVAELGIRLDNTTPVVGFQGVTGADLAYQVRLDSIEIEGRTVFDVRAIVYSLGDGEDAGLLGNDFLQHFQVDLDSVKGVLKLRKK